LYKGASLLLIAGLLGCVALSGCRQEARTVGPSVPQTPPGSDDDPRIAAFQGNLYQVAQGGRYFNWYGCSGCHTDAAPGVLNLPDSRWRHGSGFAQVYAAVVDRHGALDFRGRIPTEQLWQLTAYVRDLPKHTPEKRRRLEADQKGEPVGPAWSGPR
jgi:cytochrome c oxidase cbb3-type subunit III